MGRGQLTWNLCCINLSKYVMAGRPEKNKEVSIRIVPRRGGETRGECRPTSELTLDNAAAGGGKN